MRIVDFVECVETWVVLCDDGKYYIAIRHDMPQRPSPCNEVYEEKWEIRGPGFATPEEARKWWFEPEEVEV